MTRLRGLVLGFVLVGLGGPATACINDSELPSHEREFRSSYGQWAGRPSSGDSSSAYPVHHGLLAGGGAVLLVGAFGLAARRTRSGV